MADVRALPSRSRLFGSVAGVVLLLVLWQIIGQTQVFGSSISSLTTVAAVWTDSSQNSVIAQAAWSTAREALTGFVGGGLIALVASALVVLVPPLRRGVDQLATISSAIPYVALAPILLGICSQGSIPAAMAGISVFFPDLCLRRQRADLGADRPHRGLHRVRRRPITNGCCGPSSPPHFRC